MSQFKNNPNIRLYYTDTDSIFIDSDLSDDLVNNEIGNFKLENIFKEIVFKFVNNFTYIKYVLIINYFNFIISNNLNIFFFGVTVKK